MEQLSFWKVIIALIFQFAGVVWVARGVVSNTEVNAKAIFDTQKKIEVIAAEQLKRSQSVWTGSAKLESMEKRLDRMDNKLDRIWDKLK